MNDKHVVTVPIKIIFLYTYMGDCKMNKIKIIMNTIIILFIITIITIITLCGINKNNTYDDKIKNEPKINVVHDVGEIKIQKNVWDVYFEN